MIPDVPHRLPPRERRACHLAAADILARGEAREAAGEFRLERAAGTLAIAGALFADLAAAGLAETAGRAGARVARLTEAGRALLREDDRARALRGDAPAA